MLYIYSVSRDKIWNSFMLHAELLGILKLLTQSHKIFHVTSEQKPDIQSCKNWQRNHNRDLQAELLLVKAHRTICGNLIELCTVEIEELLMYQLAKEKNHHKIQLSNRFFIN
jgi:hypothetical protein